MPEDEINHGTLDTNDDGPLSEYSANLNVGDTISLSEVVGKVRSIEDGIISFSIEQVTVPGEDETPVNVDNDEDEEPEPDEGAGPKIALIIAKGNRGK